jgi:hypothetical protein
MVFSVLYCESEAYGVATSIIRIDSIFLEALDKLLALISLNFHVYLTLAVERG